MRFSLLSIAINFASLFPRAMRATAFMFALVFLSTVFCVTPVFAQSNAITTAGAGDVTTTLGSLPFFPNGLQIDKFGTIYKTVVDGTASAPAVAGKIVYFNGTKWLQAATANLVLPWGQYGVVITAASALNGNALIAVKGTVTCSVLTGGTTAVAVNTPLAITATGDLTATVAATTPGITWGIGVQTLAISQPATLITCTIGGY